MLLEGIKVGFALTGSFCTLEKILPEMEKMVSEGAEVYPIVSEAVDRLDTKFGRAEDWKSRIRAITGKSIIASIVDAEPIGPKSYLDILVIAPCTGNTLAKIANGITDTPVTMACKAHLRNCKPVVVSISTNDGLGANAKNLGLILNTKNMYLVPFGQDNPTGKPNSLVANTELLVPVVVQALKGRQIQPVLL